jgi:hypothetical protein
MPTFGSDRDQSNCPEHREMLGDLRLAQLQPIDKVADGGLPGTEGVEEFPTAAFSDSVERIGGRRSSGHNGIICSYRYMSTLAADRTSLGLRVGENRLEAASGIALSSE